MKKIALLFLFISNFCFSQNQEELAIQKTINQLFEGMKNADSVVVKNVFSENAILQTINSKSEVHSEDFRKFQNRFPISKKEI